MSIPQRYQHVQFTSPGKADLVEIDSAPLIAGDSVLIETEFSIVSPGTGLAILSGNEWWAPLPFTPGYGSVGKVVRAGKEGPKEGERVFTYGPHSRYGWTSVMTVPVAKGIDPAKATFARIAAVSITSLRMADVALGDWVAVVGLGLVGNLAAQLFALSGCTVIGIDPSEGRRDLAKRCGIAHTLAPGADLQKAVKELTGGRMCRTVVEATGVPAVAKDAIGLAGSNGEFILLGSPRGEYQTDLTSFLNHSHLWDKGCVTIKGAHEWRFPVREEAHARHSLERNVRVLLDLIGEGKLKVEPLLTHLVSPAKCQEVYDGLKAKNESYLGVVFDWARA